MKLFDENIISTLLESVQKIDNDPRTENRFVRMIGMLPFTVSVVVDEQIFTITPNQILDERYDVVTNLINKPDKEDITSLIEMGTWDDCLDCILNNLLKAAPVTTQKGPMMAMSMN